MESEKPKRRGGCTSDEARAKASAKMKGHKRIRDSRPSLCEVCHKRPAVDHVKVEGVRTWMCTVCFNTETPGYLDNELERHVYSGQNYLSRMREGG